MKLVVLTLETIRLEMKMPLLKGSGSNQLFKFFAAVGNFCNCKNVLQQRLITFEG